MISSWLTAFLFLATVCLEPPQYAEIQVIDEENGRPVPMVELETVNGLRFVTDNAGRVAFHEPGLMDTEVFLFVRSHGYKIPKDGFGYEGIKVVPSIGKVTQIKIHRTNIASRLCRLTGEGRLRDSILLGYQESELDAVSQGLVAGQDSVQAAIYNDKIYWLWGDTNRMNYPLGLFRTAGATTPFPISKRVVADWSRGIPYDYFVDSNTGFARPMLPLTERPEGVIWMFGLFVVPDEHGIPKLVCHYSRRKGLTSELEQGIAVFDDSSAEFVPVMQLPLDEKWRFPSGHPIRFEEEGKTWLLFGSPSPNVRVPATLDAVLDTTQYEAFTCANRSGPLKDLTPKLDQNKVPMWRWQKELPPVNSEQEQRWVKAGQLKATETRFLPVDTEHSADRITLHRGSVRWNTYRKKWILISGQIHGKASMLGEVWYAEADHPTGPFRQAIQIVTHDRQTFYNVCHHDFLDRDGGRVVYFEGTYTNDFSGNSDKTPRYNYNQILYELDLSVLSSQKE